MMTNEQNNQITGDVQNGDGAQSQAATQKGTELLQRGDFGGARACYLEAAGEGDYMAMYNLACMHYFGDGCEVDYAKALEWYERAALYGDPEAAAHAGAMYGRGEGCEPDGGRAFVWCLVAAERGSLSGMANLGECLVSGHGCAQDRELGLSWLERASVAGNGIASVRLAELAETPAKAVTYLERGKAQKYSVAIERLAACYEEGRGVEADAQYAAELRELAANTPDED